MRLRRVDAALVLLAVASVVPAAIEWRAAAAAPSSFALPQSAAPLPSAPEETPLLSLAQEVTSRNPFRLSNRPSLVRHGEQPIAHAVAPLAYRPTLSLKAIVGGPPWTALIAGIPGVVGIAMVSRGDRVDLLEIRSITRDTVVLRGTDTTWVLTIDQGRPD